MFCKINEVKKENEFCFYVIFHEWKDYADIGSYLLTKKADFKSAEKAEKFARWAEEDVYFGSEFGFRIKVYEYGKGWIGGSLRRAKDIITIKLLSYQLNSTYILPKGRLKVINKTVETKINLNEEGFVNE